MYIKKLPTGSVSACISFIFNPKKTHDLRFKTVLYTNIFQATVGLGRLLRNRITLFFGAPNTTSHLHSYILSIFHFLGSPLG